MPKRRGGPRTRRYLPALTRRQHSSLDRLLRQAIKNWDAEGWAFVGTPPRVRVAVLVAKKLASPRNPADTIALPDSLGGGELKVSVLALHRDARPITSTAGSALPAGAGTSYLAPGVPIGCDNERVGLGAVFRINGAPHIVTCAHALSSSQSTLTTCDGSTEIGTLRDDFLSSGGGLDAAVFTVTTDGLALLDAGKTVTTWCDSFHEPAAGDNGHEVTFWPTWTDSQSSFVEDILSFSSSVPGGVGDGYVMLPCCTALGDSGSLLQLGSAYYGLASQRDGNYSFFTPLSLVKRRLQQAGANVTTWRPT